MAASRHIPWDGNVGNLDSYDASKGLRSCNTVKFNCCRNDKTNERDVYVKICGILNVISTYNGGHIRRHLGLLTEMLL